MKYSIGLSALAMGYYQAIALYTLMGHLLMVRATMNGQGRVSASSRWTLADVLWLQRMGFRPAGLQPFTEPSFGPCTSLAD